MPASTNMQRLVASPCSLPERPFAELLPLYAGIGFRKWEVFTSWAASHFDPTAEAAHYLELARPYGMRFTSLHLPPVSAADPASLDQAVAAARFAAALGVGVVLYKARTRADYIACAVPLLDALADLPLIPVVQNHFGTAVSTLEDLNAVMDGIADRRMGVLLEVGHFAKAGIHWAAPCERYADRIALVHVKDMAGTEPVPFGQGEVDFDGLFARLDAIGYRGDIVVEIEVAVDEEARLRLMAEACDYLYAHGLKEN